MEVKRAGPEAHTKARLERAWGEERQTQEDVLEIRSKAGTDARLLGGSVHGHEDEVSLADGLVDVRGEEEVAAARLLDDFKEPGLVDWELVIRAVPRVDTGLVEVDDGDLDVRAFEGNDGARRATYASSARERFV